MTRSARISIGLVVAASFVLALVIAITLTSQDDEDAPTDRTPTTADDLAPVDSIRLAEAPEGSPVLVEFLDFECEACRALKPLIDDIIETYDGDIEVVARYMPLHASSVNAAKAAEAADAQGKFPEMYDLLFESQPEWGEQQEPEEQYFFDLAEQLGLDMDEFRAVYDDPATEAKIERDQAAGEAAGVTGTPTLFLDGERLELQTAEDLINAVTEAVGR